MANKPELDLEARYHRYMSLSGIRLSEMTDEQRYTHKRAFFMGCHAIMEILINDVRRLDQISFQEACVDLRKQILTVLYSKHNN